MCRWREKFAIRFEFRSQDVWVGVYHKHYWEAGYRTHDYWICVLPMFPLFVSIVGRKAMEGDR